MTDERHEEGTNSPSENVSAKKPHGGNDWLFSKWYSQVTGWAKELMGILKPVYIPVQPGNELLPKRVRQCEEDSINKRRRTMNVLLRRDTRYQQEEGERAEGERHGEAQLNLLPSLPDSSDQISVRPVLGLGLSGGGIRSASFNLGVIQSLMHSKTVKYTHVDYISSVSGGGYIASCVSALGASGETHIDKLLHDEELETPIDSPEAKKERRLIKFMLNPFHHQFGEKESIIFQHLRNYANYLMPPHQNKVTRAMKFPIIMVRGILINLVMIFGWCVLGAIGVMLLWSDRVNEMINRTKETMPENMCSLSAIDFPFGYHAFLLIGLLLGMLAVLWLVVLLQQTFNHKRAGAYGSLLWGFRNVYLNVHVIIVLIVLVALFAYALPFCVYFLAVCTGEDYTRLQLFSGVGTAFIAVVTFLIRKINLADSPMMNAAAKFLISMLLPVSILILVLGLASILIKPPEGFDLFQITLFDYTFFDVKALENGDYRSGLWGYAGIFLVLYLFKPFFDANETSLHTFYRDHLSKTFLFDPWKAIQENEVNANGGSDMGAQVQHTDALPLTFLSEHCAPYHIINAAVNIPNSKNWNMRGRDAASFVFTKHYTGSQVSGYARTDMLGKVDRNLTLGTAMAISGAAVAPNMGRKTTGYLRFIMAFLNLRLGYWLPNPSSVKGLNSLMLRHGFLAGMRRYYEGLFYRSFLLLREYLGLGLDEQSRYLMLSDGGHFDNLGLYELIRRRCKLIIISDAEADPDMTFNGLAEAVRLARIDFGVLIDIDVDHIKRNANTGLSAKHYAVGEIHYSKTEIGYLLYIKSSLSGDENIDIDEYHAREPSYSHQTTADQFFDEVQFEAYRALGRHIADGVFNVRSERIKGTALERWMQAVEDVYIQKPKALSEK